jgi:hypothetical protein
VGGELLDASAAGMGLGVADVVDVVFGGVPFGDVRNWRARSASRSRTSSRSWSISSLTPESVVYAGSAGGGFDAGGERLGGGGGRAGRVSRRRRRVCGREPRPP